jgi:NADH dehydrogenase FAD-containing subunit
VPVKPVENLLAVRQRLLTKCGRTQRVLVVGGGPAGVELAANLSKLARDHRLDLEITLLDAAPHLLARMPARAGRIAARVLLQQGVELRLGCSITSLEDNRARTADDVELAYDLALITTGIVPHSLYHHSGLATDPAGGLRVDKCLQAVGHPEIFGGGDCVSFDASPLARVGVYAIRQGPVLLHNLQAKLRGTPLTMFRPQQRYLLILNLGDGTGLVVWGPAVWRSRLGFTWKNHLDISFMQSFQLCGELIVNKGVS